MKNLSPSRRHFIRSSAFGLIGITTFNLSFAKNNPAHLYTPGDDKKLFYRYPAQNDDMVSAVVGASHSNLEKVRELVTARPELAKASWDWGFGDWETALGAASHVGRRDIAELLMGYGARPDIFTMAMLGSYKAVQEMVETIPNIQSIPGPHGITLLQHAKNRLRFSDISETEKKNVNNVVTYLEKLGNADVLAKSLDITEEEQKKYIGEYRFGEGADEIFTVDLNTRKLLQVSRKGTFGRVMNRIDDHTFSPGGAPSVNISFAIKEGNSVSFTIHEPEPIITATRI